MTTLLEPVKNDSATASMQRCWLTWVGATTGCLRALGVNCDTADVAGQSGYAFRIIISDTLCASGPTAFDWNTLLQGVWRLGRSTAVFQAPECHNVTHHNKGTLEHCRAALRFAAHEWAVGRPSVLWGVYVPEFAIVTNIVDGQAFDVDSYRRFTGEEQPSIYFDELNAPGGIYALAFPTAMKVSTAAGDRAAVVNAVDVMTYRARTSRLASGDAAYSLWIKALTEGKADPFGNAYNAQCWAEARHLAATFIKRVADRSALIRPPLMSASTALKTAALELRYVAKRFSFPGNKEQLSFDNCEAAAELLDSAAKADAGACEALRRAVDLWPEM